MKNKIAAILLCLGVAISTLCACSSTGNGVDQPAEETTTKQTEAVTEAPTTEETTEETTTTSEPTDTQSGEDEIIYLFDYGFTSQIKNMDPSTIAGDFYSTIAPYMSVCEIQSSDAATVYCLCVESVPRDTFELSNIAGTTSASVGVLLVVTNPGIVTTSFNTTEDSDSMDFVPLFYNATKHCFAGYYGYNTNNPSFREVYWDAGLAVPVDVDPSLYGF